MKIATLLSAAALVVALGLTSAQAQVPGEMGQGGPPAAAPGGELGGPGGGPDLGPPPGAGARPDDLGGPGLSGPRGERPGLSAEGEGDIGLQKGGKAGAKAESEGGMKHDGKAGAQAEGKGDLETGKTGTKSEGDIGAEGKTGATAEGEKAGKPGKSARLESQQVSKVKTYFSQHKPRVKSIDRTAVSVSIGVALPGSIVLYDLPPDLIVVGGPCPVRYFVWGDDIVLVDSCTREVVEIIVGVA
jgi:hypothetical protein